MVIRERKRPDRLMIAVFGEVVTPFRGWRLARAFFRLRDSNRYCGSYLTVADAAEILGVPEQALAQLPTREHKGEHW